MQVVQNQVSAVNEMMPQDTQSSEHLSAYKLLKFILEPQHRFCSADLAAICHAQACSAAHATKNQIFHEFIEEEKKIVPDLFMGLLMGMSCTMFMLCPLLLKARKGFETPGLLPAIRPAIC